MKVSRRLNLLFKVSRPAGYLILPGSFLVGWNSTSAGITLELVIQALSLSFPVSMYIYGLNDFGDQESDSMNSRKGGLEGAVLEGREESQFVRRMAILSGIIVISASIVTLRPLNILSIAGLIILGYIYSLSFRIKEKPPLDSLSNGLGYFFLPFLAGASYGLVSVNALADASIIALAVAGIHSFTTIMDYRADRSAGDNTMAVKYGKKGAALFSLILLTPAALMADFSLFTNLYIWFLTSYVLLGAFYPKEIYARLFLYLAGAGYILVLISSLLLR